MVETFSLKQIKEMGEGKLWNGEECWRKLSTDDVFFLKERKSLLRLEKEKKNKATAAKD